MNKVEEILNIIFKDVEAQAKKGLIKSFTLIGTIIYVFLNLYTLFFMVAGLILFLLTISGHSDFTTNWGYILLGFVCFILRYGVKLIIRNQ